MGIVKQLPEPSSIQKMLLLIVQLCRKIIFIDSSIKVGLYISLVLFGSTISDVLPIPGSYFSRKNNLFNVYFVKLSWAWSMAFVGSFVYLTSNVYCCGDKVKIGKHLLRLLVATLNWFLWTRLFDHVEDNYGYCGWTIMRIAGKESCLSGGFPWSAFSISGHTFILIYCNLIIMEEAKALIFWDAVKDHLTNEETRRNCADGGPAVSFLHSLTNEELAHVKVTYEKCTPFIQAIFMAMTFLALVWDVMLLATITYFHTTLEKLVASVVVVLLWFFTYRFLFHRRLFALLPGDGELIFMKPVK